MQYIFKKFTRNLEIEVIWLLKTRASWNIYARSLFDKHVGNDIILLDNLKISSYCLIHSKDKSPLFLLNL